MKVRNGFTLIELLAVIVILVIIVLIATPLVLNIIEKSKKHSFLNSAYGIVESAKLYYAEGLLGGNHEEEKIFLFDQDNIGLTFKGKSPKGGFLKLNRDGKVSLAFYNDTWCASKSEDENEITISKYEKENCNVVRTYTLYEKILSDNKVSNNCPTIHGDYAELSSVEVNDLFCMLDDDYGTSYYFRGASMKNYVDFGGFIWRIIRINGDQSVRMIYAGNKPLDNGVFDSSHITAINQATAGFNSGHSDNTFAGYKIGSLNATTYQSTHSNEKDSLIKVAIDTWYNSYLKEYSDYLSDTLYCNDRSLWNDNVTKLTGVQKLSQDTVKGYGTYSSNITYYAPHYRLILSAVQNGKSYATLKCPQKNDRFTVKDSVIGNAKLNYPIATITADEVFLAGALHYLNDSNPHNQSFYLYTGYSYYTMTPSSQDSYVGLQSVIGDGWISGGGTASAGRFYRPVINIKKDVVVKSGLGTKEQPYLLSH